jgi:hypothetical protein
MIWGWLGTLTHMHMCNGLGNMGSTQLQAPKCHNTPHHTTIPHFDVHDLGTYLVILPSDVTNMSNLDWIQGDILRTENNE